ncbi:hypothetical protein [Haloglycomyces albus]|uniref:hypothetical protein n=1 Tax=Haloglycomyces albus TaxID=526067 RepID=UPI00046CFD63|nr:hypothetical protein [Haloglycomyces albus]
MTPIIIPVGKSLGPVLNEKYGIDHYELLIGDEIELLDEPSWAVWNIAHSETATQGELKFDRERLTKRVLSDVDKMDRYKVQQTVDRLTSLHALVEFDPDGAGIETVLRQHIMVPSGVSYGSSPDDSDLFRIGDASGDWLDLDGWERAVWSGSYRDRSMWHACEQLAEYSDGGSALNVAEAILPAMAMVNAMFLGHWEPAK